MLHDYEIRVINLNNTNDNTMLDCSMELSLLNTLFRDDLITKIEYQDMKTRLLKEYKLL